jgi:small redox-active disulfide protein 2
MNFKEDFIMALFGFGKKKSAEEELVQCDCGGMCRPAEVAAKKVAEEAKVSASSVKVLGSGCAKCNQLEAATLEALKELEMDCTVDHVTDFSQIAAYGVMTTPALVVDGKVVSFCKVLKKDEVVKILQKVRG